MEHTIHFIFVFCFLFVLVHAQTLLYVVHTHTIVNVIAQDIYDEDIGYAMTTNLYETYNGTLYKYHIPTGDIAWNYNVSGYTYGEFLQYKNMGFIFNSTQVFAIDLNDGSLIWNSSTGTGPSVGLGKASAGLFSPLVDAIYMYNMQAVSVIEAATGKLLWRHSILCPFEYFPTYYMVVDPTVPGCIVYCNSRVISVSAHGTFQISSGLDGQGPTKVISDSQFITDYMCIYSLHTFKREWCYTSPLDGYSFRYYYQIVNSSLVLVTLLGNSSINGSALAMVNYASHKTIWINTDLPPAGNTGFTFYPTYGANGLIYVPLPYVNDVFVIDPTTGKKLTTLYNVTPALTIVTSKSIGVSIAFGDFYGTDLSV